jgi:tyrosyl-tRNA synthetase
MIEEILNRGVSEINVKKDLEEKLKSGKKLRVKFGIDPTGYDLTLGHAVPLRKLKQFQEAGHQVVLLFGNFTAQIGDPTGKTQTRKVLTKEDVEANAKTYLEQAAKIIDINKAEIVYNADWLEEMTFADVLKLAGNFTVSQMLERDMFQERIKKEQQINLVEFMYPLMQGYDSLPINADVEIGGTDQLFNMMCARTIQKANGKRPQNVVTVPILVGLDGHEKMSKSLGNYIAIMDTADEMFGKTMSIPDSLIVNYFELATELSLTEIDEIKTELASGVNPRDLKIKLAKEIVKLYHSEKDAINAEKNFVEIFRNKNIPDDMPEMEVTDSEMQLWSLVNLTKLCASNGEAKRMIEQGSVKIDSKQLKDPRSMIQIKEEMVLQIGKRKWMKILKK